MATLTLFRHTPDGDVPCAGGADTFPGQNIYEWVTDPPDLAVQYRIDGGEWTPCEQPLSIDMSNQTHLVEFRIDPDAIERDNPPPVDGETGDTYSDGDVVTFNGEEYIANTETTDIPPGPDWDLFRPDPWQEGVVYHDGDIVSYQDYVRDEWSSSATYTDGDKVTWEDKSWVLTADESTNQEPGASLVWTEYTLNYQATVPNTQTVWFSEDWTEYRPPSFGRWQVGDTVSWDGDEYVCISDTNVIPPNPTYWKKMTNAPPPPDVGGGGGGGDPGQQPLQYQPGDYVRYDGVVYVCTAETDTHPPGPGWARFVPAAYIPGHVYHAGDLVTYYEDVEHATGKAFWQCVVDNSDTVWFADDWSTWYPESWGRWQTGDVVTRAGIYFMALRPTNSRPPGSDWKQLEGPPPAEDETLYQVGDKIMRDGIIYECVSTNTKEPPPSPNWILFNPPVWTAGVIYHEGDIVYKNKVDSDGNPIKLYYECAVVNSLPVWFSAEWNEWTPERFGAWQKGDQVEYDGKTYEAQYDTNERPPSPAWKEVTTEVVIEPGPAPVIGVTVGGKDVSKYVSGGVVNGSFDSDVSRQCQIELGGEEIVVDPNSPMPSVHIGAKIVAKYNGNTVFTGDVVGTSSGSDGRLSFDAQSSEFYGIGSFKATKSKSWDRGASVSGIIKEVIAEYNICSVGSISIGSSTNMVVTLGFGDNPWTFCKDLAWKKGFMLYVNRFGDAVAVKYNGAPEHSFTSSTSGGAGNVTDYSSSTSLRDFFDTVMASCDLPDGTTIYEIATKSADGRYRVTELSIDLETKFPEKSEYTDGGKYCSDFKKAIADAKKEIRDAVKKELDDLPTQDKEVSFSFDCTVDTSVEPGDFGILNGQKTRINSFSIPLGSGSMSIGSNRGLKKKKL